MLRMYLAKGDAIHVTFHDGTNGIIHVESRSELVFHFPKEIKLMREKSAFKKLIKPNHT